MAVPKFAKGGRRLLMKALRVIKERPDTFDMGEWMSHDDTVKGRAPYCGTVACLAGHIVLAAGAPPVTSDEYALARLRGDIRQCAKKITEADPWFEETPVEDRYVMIADLAAHLVGADEKTRTGLDNFFGMVDIRTPAELERRLKAWIKTGKRVAPR